MGSDAANVKHFGGLKDYRASEGREVLVPYRGKVVEDVSDRSSGSTAIGTISRFVRDVTGNPKATCYEWNTIKGEWTVGTFQTFSLRLALGAKRAPSGSEGIK